MVKLWRLFSGLSLDHQTVSAVSRVRLSERGEESLSCFLRACDAALSYLQELDKVFFMRPGYFPHCCCCLNPDKHPCVLYFQVVTTPHMKAAKSSPLTSPVDIDLGYFLQAALQSAYLCLLQRG